jgi:hypothetical protein
MMRALARFARLAAAIAVASAAPARADVFDLALQRLVVPPSAMGAFADPNDTTNAMHKVPDAYRTLVSELGTVLAPKILTTADTIGYNGFQLAVDYSFTTINNKSCGQSDISQVADVSQCPWDWGAEGKRDGQGNHSPPPGLAHTISVYARKGIWLPLPSFEIGAGATKLMQSDIFAVQVYGKLSLHEGFHDWPIPSLAIRGSGMRVMGASQIDLTMAQIDVEVSKSFGAAGSVTIVPYLGSAVLFIIARGQVLDLTPTVDAYKPGNSADLNNNAVFQNQDAVVRWRFFGGLRLQYHVLVLTTDLLITPCGDFNGGCSADRHKNKQFADNADTQYTFSASGGFLF